MSPRPRSGGGSSSDGGIVKMGRAVRIEETELTRLMEAGNGRPPTSLCPVTVRPAAVMREGPDLGAWGDDR
jgi:hypothetical protein